MVPGNDHSFFWEARVLGRGVSRLLWQGQHSHFSATGWHLPLSCSHAGGHIMVMTKRTCSSHPSADRPLVHRRTFQPLARPRPETRRKAGWWLNTITPIVGISWQRQQGFLHVNSDYNDNRKSEPL